tara:strand:+ start:1509 stop:1688 length:180 start_codon:yes stop_codon:yes gene_type:complete
MKKTTTKLHQIEENFKKILDLTFPFCKSDNEKLSKLACELNKNCYKHLKKIRRFLDSEK